MSRRKRKPQRCILCGRKLPLDKSKTVTGATGHAVCKACLEAAGCIQSAQERQRMASMSAISAPGVLSPQELVQQLGKAIIGQEDAKKAIAIALWKQQLRAGGVQNVPRSTLLLYGPTGCGKTALVREAARLVGLPFITFDATTLSETGYRGQDAQDMVKDLFNAYPENNKTPFGVIFLDEVDKLAAQGGEYRSAYSKGTQHALLKLIEGMELRLGDHRKVNTEDILFVFGGAFSGLERIVERRVQPTRSIGFGCRQVEQIAGLAPTTEDFISYGMEPELLGRFTRKVGLSPLTADDLRRLLLHSNISTYRKYQQFFLAKGVTLALEEGHIQGWIDEALALGTGARGLQTIVEQAMEPLLFRLAQKEDNEEVTWSA